MKRRALQVAIAAVGCILLFRFAVPGMVLGASYVAGGSGVTPLLDSEVRFLSALAGGLGMILFWMIPRIEETTVLFRLILVTTFAGGLIRLLSLIQLGEPPTKALVAMVIELALPLVLVFWQASVAADRALSRRGGMA